MSLEDARAKALRASWKQKQMTLRLFDELMTRLGAKEYTAESLDEAATLEVELTGDAEATTYIGIELGFSAYAGCDCWEAQDCKVGAGHLDGCQWASDAPVQPI